MPKPPQRKPLFCRPVASNDITKATLQTISCSSSAEIPLRDAGPKYSSTYSSKDAGGSVKMLPDTKPLKSAKRKSIQKSSKAHKKFAFAHKSHPKVVKNLPTKRKSSNKIYGGQNKRSAWPREGEEALKNALLTQQRMRVDGTWVMCSNVECGKWRYMPIKDPCLIEDRWECKNNPDKSYGNCAAQEQWWDQGLKNKFVENRFTVGSLVWAKMEGWPSWPAMVDDDPDTGEFFWTEVSKGGEWELRPSFYHVVFFDSKERNVSRAWVPDRRVQRLLVGDKAKGITNERLICAIEMAKQASREDLDMRRRKYCLVTRFKGPWGSVWPDFGNDGDIDEDSDLGNEEELCREMMQEAEMESPDNISLHHDESISSTMDALSTRNEAVDDVTGKKGSKTPDKSVSVVDTSVSKVSKSMPAASPSFATYTQDLRQTADIGVLEVEYLSNSPPSSPYHSLLDPSDRDSELLLYAPSLRTSERSIFAPLSTSENINFVEKLTFVPKLSSSRNDPFTVSEGALNLTLYCSSCQMKTNYSTKLGLDESEFRCDTCMLDDHLDCEKEDCEYCKKIAAELDARWIHRKNVEGGVWITLRQ